jgi:tetrahydromethanopterin S-methyltransferase subunit E
LIVDGDEIHDDEASVVGLGAEHRVEQSDLGDGVPGPEHGVEQVDEQGLAAGRAEDSLEDEVDAGADADGAVGWMVWMNVWRGVFAELIGRWSRGLRGKGCVHWGLRAWVPLRAVARGGAAVITADQKYETPLF